MHVSIKGNLNLESRQDSNHYDSKQTQAGAGFSVAIYGSGSSASANYSQNKAKVNYAQVEEQTGFHVGKGGMDVKVAGNTHLAGSVIDSEADQDKNHFKTKSLTHTDIENRSEVEVKSVSAGLSTDMAQNAKNAMAAAASALGNKHESATSQTQSAIGSNIQIDTETPENLTALSRDTQNANHKVKAFDHNEVKEQQEAAQVAGELFSKITGDLAKKFEFEEGSKEKIAMHALAGALAAKMSDGNVATGAAAGASSEWLNTYVTDYLNEQAKDLKLDDGQKEKLKQAAQQMTALVIGAAAGAMSGGSSETMKQGALTSYNAETYNRQLHQNEKERIKLLANGDEEKERRLEIAACALVHCSAQIPEDDPRYAAEYQKEILGNTAEFANERSLLQKQTYTLDSWGAGASYPLFNYNLAYKMQDYDDAHTQIVTRAGGVAQTAYGISTAVGGGVTSCMGLATCGFGVVAGLYGLDHTLAGVKTIWTGKASQTAGGDFISKTFGMEQGSGELLYGFANPLIATSVGNVTKSAFLGDFSKGMTKGVDSTKELPIIGQVAGYSQTEAILNGVKINNFKGATPDSLSRINNFLSNTIDTTRGKGIRNATKPSYIDIETDWGALTKSAKVKNYDNGRRVAEFSDGTRAIYRPSKTGPMTIELQRPDNKKIIEVRYER